jgi:hypothetical protein
MKRCKKTGRMLVDEALKLHPDVKSVYGLTKAVARKKVQGQLYQA